MNATKSALHLIYCLLINWPAGPPEFQLEESNFQLYPIDRVKCPGIDPERDVIFELYTRANPRQPEILKMRRLIKFGSFAKPTVIFFHGFGESSNSTDAVQMREAYLTNYDYNVIVMNAKRLLAGPSYTSAVKNLIPIAQYVAQLIDYLVSKGLHRSQLHLIGMSLGAHIAGIAASLANEKPFRITGLDPAGPIFGLVPEKFRLDKSDAKFVDIIHTDAGIFGYPGNLGHVDMWINGGRAIQPGCKFYEILLRNPAPINELVFCNHWVSYQVYIRSIKDPTLFKVKKCDSWLNFIAGECENNEETLVGVATPETASGNYYIITKHPHSLK